jgi:hypothetical protein
MHARLHLTGVLAWMLVSCGCGERGPQRYEVSGVVTLDGRPLPAGQLVFTPDVTRDNSGVQAKAEIKDGRFTTTSGFGSIGGPHRVELQGFDGVPHQGPEFLHTQGKPLFAPTSAEVDLPRQSAKLVIDVTLENNQPTLSVRVGEP